MADWPLRKRPWELVEEDLTDDYYGTKRLGPDVDPSIGFHDQTSASVPETSGHQIDGEICFGMLVNISVQFDPRLSFNINETGTPENKLASLELVLTEGRCDVQSNGVFIGSMNKKTHSQLNHISKKMPLNYTGLIQPQKLMPGGDSLQANSVSGPVKMIDTLDILVTGSRSIADVVGEELSRHYLFLQHPHSMVTDLPYINPQYLYMVESSSLQDMPPPPQVHTMETKPVLLSDSDEDESSDLIKIMEDLPNHEYTNEVNIHDQITTPLLKSVPSSDYDGTMMLIGSLSHQKEAVNFITERELLTEHKSESLWETENSHGSESQTYRHAIVGTKSSKEDDIPGGIFADGMGLGKTLTMIARISASFPEAEEYVTNLIAGGEYSTALPTPVKSTLVIVPSELLMDGWIDEIKKHVADGAMSVYRYHGPNRRLPMGKDLPYHIVVTTYGTISTDFRNDAGGVLYSYHWHRVILDEAHTVRNHSTKNFKAVMGLSACIRWCMTGTVIQNSLDDLASLIRFLRIPLLDDPGTFRRYISGKKKLTHEHSVPDYSNLKLLLRSICFGRNTSTILSTLGVTYTVCRPCLSDSERKTYDKFAIMCTESIKAAVNDAPTKKGSSPVLAAVLRLRIFCNTGLVGSSKDNLEDAAEELRDDEVLTLREQEGHAIHVESNLEYGNQKHKKENTHTKPAKPSRNCDNNFERTQAVDCQRVAISNSASSITPIDWTPSPSAYPSKMKALVEDVRKHYLNEKCIVFSCWTRTLDLVGRIFYQEDIIFGRVDGGMNTAHRKQVLLDFQENPDTRVLLMTVGTGAVGLNNLSVASRVHIIEPQWNPAVESQAIGRLFRLGQVQQVCVIRYVIDHTIEESIESRQIWKKQLASNGGLQSFDRGGSERTRKNGYLRELGKIIGSTVSTEMTDQTQMEVAIVRKRQKNL